MQAPPASRHLLEIDRGSAPPTGRFLNDEGAVEYEFRGWVEIATAIQHLAQDGQPAPEPADD